MRPIDDITKNYHGGNPISIEANERVRPHTAGMEERILTFMAQRPLTRTWVKEVIRELGIKHQTASARLTQLKAQGKIEPVLHNGKQIRVEGCGVVQLVAKQGELFNIEQGDLFGYGDH